MSKTIALNKLTGSSVDIMNFVRANAGSMYQAQVPVVESLIDIPAVGDTIYGYPALANQFISALVNVITLTEIKTANFTNPFGAIKKGTLAYGDTIEEAFVGMAKAREFNVEKAPMRELKRTLPDVKSAFHVINWDVQYPITIQGDDLYRAFHTENGLLDLIAKIEESIGRGREYDEYLLFKYLLIKGFARQEIMTKPLTDAGTTLEQKAAVTFRALSNQMGFINTDYNKAGVHTATPRSDQIIIMDADFNAQFDVLELANAFHMDKADYMGRLILVDSFKTFDNDRFDVIRANSSMIEEVTDDDLEAMANVHAIICDQEYFQFYQRLERFTEKFVASGDYWNYFFRDVKTVSTSPFSNAVAITGTV